MIEFAHLNEKTQALLNKLGIYQDFDLILHFPTRYESAAQKYAIGHAPNGQTVQIEGTIQTQTIRPSRPNASSQLSAIVRDDTGSLRLRFLRFYPNQRTLLSEGNTIRATGIIREHYGVREMIHPTLQTASATTETKTPQNTPFTCIYPCTQGLTQKRLNALIQQALSRHELTDTLPPSLLKTLGLISFSKAVHILHTPPTTQDAQFEHQLKAAKARICFDELLAQQLSMRLAYRERARHQSPPLLPNFQLRTPFLAQLPFSMTAAQMRSVEEIDQDLAKPSPMHRLLQGDVGAGKTLVAALAALTAIESGFQVAIMAPTEILAEQHFQQFQAWFAPLNLSVAWLTGNLRSKTRKHALELIETGMAHCVIGTHALFQNDVKFAKLALVIIDEQHRFGVDQRLKLKEKGQNPHQLMMSATPIPRTLAMSFYADLDVSVIDELPPNRKPVKTRLFAQHRRPQLLQALTQHIDAGRQVYWVCPLIETSDTLELQAASDTYAELSQALPHYSIALLHSKIKSAEKAHIMSEFQANRVHILVATTVIEVGVNVPNASLMVIEHAERMGLSQLHQLRGRVGRGEHESQCILLFDEPLSQLARQRLKIMFEQTDGFEIARQDLLLRGPGELLGAKQSGTPMLRFAELERDVEWLEKARNLAPKLLEREPEIARAHLKRWLSGRENYLRA